MDLYYLRRTAFHFYDATKCIVLIEDAIVNGVNANVIHWLQKACVCLCERACWDDAIFWLHHLRKMQSRY